MLEFINKIKNEYSNRSVCVTDSNLDLPGPKIVYVSPGFTKLMGYSEEEIMGKTPRIFQGPNTDRAMLDKLKSDLKTKGSFQGQAINYKKDGTEFLMVWSISSIKSPDGELLNYVAIQNDATASTALNYLSQILEVQQRILERLEKAA